MQLFVLEAIGWLAKLRSHKWCQLMMPKIISRSHDPHVLKTMLAQHRTRRP